MGMFDTFIGTIKCNKCKNEFEFEKQTKSYDCLLGTFELGDYIDKGNTNYFYKFDYPCSFCKSNQNIKIAIRKGQIVGFFNEHINMEELYKLDNIEDGYAKNNRYKKMCEDMIGYDFNPLYKLPETLKEKDIIVALNSEWIIDKIYKEVLKEKINEEDKLYNFYKFRFVDNFICECHNQKNDTKRILVLKKNKGISIKEFILEQKENWDNEDYKTRYIKQSHCDLISI